MMHCNPGISQVSWLVMSLVALVGLLPAWSASPPAPPPSPPPLLAITPTDAGNLALVETLTPTYAILRLTSPAHNWFCGAFTDLPTDTPVTLGISMTGNDTLGNVASVRKWEGLRPVMTYADPTVEAAYEWYAKDAKGWWVSSDPLRVGRERYAGNRATPVQAAMPDAVAPAFLSADGKIWCPWREIDRAEAATGVNIFRLTQTFAQPDATVAMRVPYTSTYVQAFLARLQEAARPGVCVDTLGTTPGGRTLSAIRITDPECPREDIRTILVIAREHATEHASSWALHGMVQALLRDDATAKALRAKTTWLFIPIQDPDGSARSEFDRLTRLFFGQPGSANMPPEALLYARYLTDYVYQGHTLDLAVSLHNVEANEAPNLAFPYRNPQVEAETMAINRALIKALQPLGVRTADPARPWDESFMTFRLYCWCALHFGTLDLAYEVNDRYPARRMTLPELQRLGAVMAQTLAGWRDSPAGQQWHARVAKFQQITALERQVYFQKAGYPPEHRTPYDLVIRGY